MSLSGQTAFHVFRKNFCTILLIMVVGSIFIGMFFIIITTSGKDNG